LNELPFLGIWTTWKPFADIGASAFENGLVRDLSLPFPWPWGHKPTKKRVSKKFLTTFGPIAHPILGAGGQKFNHLFAE